MVVFDKLAGRVLAARDPNGAEPLFWGTADFGNALLFSTDAGLLAKQCADADAFPRGRCSARECGDVTGELTMLSFCVLVPGDDDGARWTFGRRRRRDGAARARTAARAVRVAETAPARASDESSGERRVFLESLLESRGDAAA